MKKLNLTLLVTGIMCCISITLKAQKIGELNSKTEAGQLQFIKRTSANKETKSGLLYSVDKKGNGEKPSKFNKVKVNYNLMSMDSMDNLIPAEGKTVEIQLERLPYGIQEAIKMMPLGAIWNLTMPSKLVNSKYEKLGKKGKVYLSRVELISVSK